MNAIVKLWQKWGKLTVVAYVGRNEWHTICDCGKFYAVKEKDLATRRATACPACYEGPEAKPC